MESMNELPLIAIVGETAAGKSSIAMDIAERFDGEIVAADAWTVYTHCDIGTAKPSKVDMQRVPHHLVNILEPSQQCNVAEYQRLAQTAINDIRSRNMLPILVGGSGLYVDCVLFDYQFGQVADPVIRQALERLSITELQKEVIDRGLRTEGVDLANRRRVIRLIESNGAISKKAGMRDDTIVIGVVLPASLRNERIEKRVDDMFRLGLETEVGQLLSTFGRSAVPMQAIGYREFLAYFEGGQTIEQTRDLIVQHTRQLAKKQRTWFRRNKSIQWVEDRQQAVDLVTTYLNNYRR